MGTPLYPKDMASEWNKLRRDVRNAFTSANLRTGMAKIGAKVIEITGQLALNAGAILTAKYDNNIDALRIGPVTWNGLPAGQFAVKRFDGSIALQVFGGTGVTGYFSIQDPAGHIIMSDDAISGQGLARPWLPYTWYRTNQMFSPLDISTSTTFATHHSLFGYMQHPKINIMGWVQCNGSDTAEVRIRQPGSGKIVATSGTVGSGWIILVGNHDEYEFGNGFQYDIEVRRVSGTGTGVGFTIVRAYGQQS